MFPLARRTKLFLCLNKGKDKYFRINEFLSFRINSHESEAALDAFFPENLLSLYVSSNILADEVYFFPQCQDDFHRELLKTFTEFKGLFAFEWRRMIEENKC